MSELTKSIIDLLKTANEKEKISIGKNPSTKEIILGFENFKTFNKMESLPNGRNFMNEIYKIDEVIVGYNSFFVFNNAKATGYEREFIDMGNGLDYVYFKKIFVHPDFREQGIGSMFVQNNLDIAEFLGKHSIIDIEKNNYRMSNILLNQNFQEDFNWIAKNGLKMVRYFHE